MKPQNSKSEFETLLMQRELSLSALTVDQACQAMLDFYRSHRAEGCDLSADGDKVLVQWDVVDSEENGHCLEWNLTRQFMLTETSDEESDDDEPIWQLSLTMRFPLKDSPAALPAGNKWCPTPRPQAVDYFEKFIRESPAYKLAATLSAASVELDFFNAG